MGRSRGAEEDVVESGANDLEPVQAVSVDCDHAAGARGPPRSSAHDRRDHVVAIRRIRPRPTSHTVARSVSSGNSKRTVVAPKALMSAEDVPSATIWPLAMMASRSQSRSASSM